MVEKGKKYLIVGLGKTGIETARFLMKQTGVQVKAVDSKKPDELSPDAGELGERGLDIKTGPHDTAQFEWADTVILSPGVSYNNPVIREFLNKGKKIISEIEFASSFISKPVIAVTGSNGKTTTVSILEKVMAENGYRVFLGGNIGTPLVTIADSDEQYDYIILELSSFQLQGTISFKPYISTILNISQNHLDHHCDFREYLQAKLNLFRNVDKNDWVVYNRDDHLLAKEISKLNSRKLTTGIDKQCDVYRSGSCVITKKGKYDLSGIKLMGEHNLQNCMTVIAIAELTDCKPGLTNHAINSFEPLEHRTELLKTLKGVKIYNDSKSTTPDSTLHAVMSFDSPVILIIGGKDKGLDYTVLNTQIKRNVKHLVIFGEARNKLDRQLCGNIKRTLVKTLAEATREAFSLSRNGDSILFSPACSSFDMFSSYIERGKEFKRIVELL